MAEPHCMTCKHCDILSGDQGRCTYEPPTPFPVVGPQGQSGTITVWPMVQLAKDHCGRYDEQLVKPPGNVIHLDRRPGVK